MERIKGKKKYIYLGKDSGESLGIFNYVDVIT